MADVRSMIVGQDEPQRQTPSLPSLREWVVRYIDPWNGERKEVLVRAHSVSQDQHVVWFTAGWIENGDVRVGTTRAIQHWYELEEVRFDLQPTVS